VTALAIDQYLETGTVQKPHRFLTAVVSFARRKPISAASAVVLVIVCSLALAAPWIAPYAPNAQNLSARLAAPGAAHWLGADQLGRDVWTRVMYGARTSLAAGLGATGVGISAGVLIGLCGGYAGGSVDFVVQRIMDAIMALPPIILLMVLSTVLSPSLRNVILAIAVIVTPGSSRVVRGAVLAIKETTYVEAALALGASPRRVIFRHILPNIMAPVIVIASVSVGSVIIVEAALGFLGLSVRQPTATWGNMLNTGAQSYMERAPWMALAPGLAIGVTVFSINLLGDGLRDVLDPRLRGRGK
jgi:peptide/nickel transport system permease protein